jgi:thiamine kinase
MHSEFSSVIHELKQVLGEDIHITALQGGAINRSFCVEQGDKRYFLKLFDNATVEKLDRQALFYQQQYLAKEGLAPSPVYLSNNRDFQLDHWISATNLQQSTLTRLEKCELLAHTLSKIHHFDMPLVKLDLEHDWRYYLSLCNRKLTTAEQQEMSVMLNYWQQQSQQLSVVCHNDLAFCHVTESPATVVFDWEYSALSNPFFDLASCISINQLSESEQNVLITTYALNMALAVADVRHKVAKMLPVVVKTNELWSLAFVR